MRVANKSLSKVTGSGSVQLTTDICLHSVLFVLDLACNLLSVSKLNHDLACTIKFFVDSCVFLDLTSERMIDIADLSSRLYILKMDASNSHLTETVADPPCPTLFHL